jgi:hypothetical protein
MFAILFAIIFYYVFGMNAILAFLSGIALFIVLKSLSKTI